MAVDGTTERRQDSGTVAGRYKIIGIRFWLRIEKGEHCFGITRHVQEVSSPDDEAFRRVTVRLPG